MSTIIVSEVANGKLYHPNKVYEKIFFYFFFFIKNGQKKKETNFSNEKEF